MSIDSMNGLAGARLTNLAVSFFDRLTRLTEEPPGAPAALPEPPATTEAGQPAAPAILTPEMLRAALIEIGAAPDTENLALAEALARFGLPLTAPTLAEAHAALGRTGGASPLAFALAKALALPTSPAILNALAAVSGGIPQARQLPEGVLEMLSLSVNADGEPDALAAQLQLLTGQIGQSTENRLAIAEQHEVSSVIDLRTTLLQIAQGSADRKVRLAADALSSHIEGQQLINQTTLHGQDPALGVPLYFALPLHADGERSQLEMRVWHHPMPPEGGWDDEDAPKLRATLRVATSRLGRIEAELTGTAAGDLSCRLGSEKPATGRLLQRHAASLASALAATGWRGCDVQCRTKAEWPPLWHGGDALTSPRARVDQRA